MSWQARRWQPHVLFGGLGADTQRYNPPLNSIKVKAPRPGTFYRPRLGIHPATVARVAYKDQNIMSTPAGLKLMNDSSWNRHIRYATNGYENYSHINEGMQYNPKYNPNNPLSVYGSGNAYPVVWIPPADGREPEAFFGWVPPMTQPGTGPAGPGGPGGPEGHPGDTGPPGPLGPAGPVGPAGQMGPPGQTGPAGQIGPRGPAGAGAGDPITGPTGPMGPAGPSGAIGPGGAMGPQGPSGAPGSGGGVIDQSMIDASIARYMTANPQAAGQPGPRGPMGPAGPRGKAGSGGVGDGKGVGSLAVLGVISGVTSIFS